MSRVAAFAGRLAGRAWRAVTWPFRSLWRVLVLGWLVGFAVVGAAGSAVADTGLIGGPDLSGGAALTVFEQAPWAGYGLPVFVPPAYAWPEQALWAAVNFLCLLLQTISAMFVRGALAGMQWMLNLTLYRDNSGEIDSATQGVASSVFWPLIGCTVAVAGFTMYARAKRDGGGAILGEAVKVAVLAVLAIAFVVHPSNVVGPLDDARTAGADAIMTGYSSGHLATGGAVAGFPPVTVPPGPNSASRTLADSMWSTFVLTPWCYAALGGEDLCRQWGQDIITKSDRWKGVAAGIMVADAFNEVQQDSKPDVCVQTFADACDTVRGVTMNRLAASLVGALVAIPLALMIIILTVFGLLAALGVLFLALMAPLFVVGWMIPGIPRTIGLKWFQALLACMIQSALIAALFGVVMVLGGILQAMIPTYGFWMVGLLNLVVMIMALRVRSMFETMIGMAHPAAAGLMSSYVAMKALGAVGRMGKRVGHAGAGAVGLAGRGAVAAGGIGASGFMNAGGRGLPSVTPSRIRNLDLRRHFPAPAAPGGIAPPYRTAPTPQTAVPAGSFAQPPQYNGGVHVGGRYAVPGRTVDALPTSTPAGRRAITPVPSSLASTDGPTARPPASSRQAGRGTAATPAAPPRTFTSGSTSEQGPVQSAQRVTVMPPRSGLLSPATYRSNPLVITRLAKPVTSKAELLGHRPPRKDQTS